jgi:hypothetical protein
MSDSFTFSIAKTDAGVSLINKIHQNLYHDNNETKTNRFDINITQILLFMIHDNIIYDSHISILKIPIRIRSRCTIAYNNFTECIYLMPNVVDDPENIDKNLIKELSYSDINDIVQTSISRFECINRPMVSPLSFTDTVINTPIVVEDDEIFMSYDME